MLTDINGNYTQSSVMVLENKLCTKFFDVSVNKI